MQDNITLEGTYEKGELRTNGETSLTIPGSNATLKVRTCLELATKRLSEVTYRSTSMPPATGQIEVTGTYRNDELCLQGETDLKLPGSAVDLLGTICPICAMVFNSGGHVQRDRPVPPFGNVEVEGTYADQNLCVAAIQGYIQLLPIPGANIHDVTAKTCMVNNRFDSFNITHFTIGDGASALTMKAGRHEANGSSTMSLALAPGCQVGGVCGRYSSTCEEANYYPSMDVVHRIAGAPNEMKQLGLTCRAR